MVLKTYKGKFNSGNTIRVPSKRRQQQYASTPLIGRSIQPGAGYHQDDISDGYVLRQGQSCIDDGNLGSEGLMYSLNKKARWNLPDLLKENLHSPKGTQYSECGVTLTERHKLSKRGKDFCVGYYTNQGIDRHSKKNKKKYFEHQNLINQQISEEQNGNESSSKRKSKKKVRNNRDKRNSDRGGSTDAEENTQTLTQIKYDVYYPSPSSSVISLSTKLKGFAEGHTSDGKAKGTKGKGSHKRHLVCDTADYEPRKQKGTWSFDDYDDLYEEVYFAEMCTDQDHTHRNESTFSDYIEVALSMKTECHVENETEDLSSSDESGSEKQTPAISKPANTHSLSERLRKKEHIVYIEGRKNKRKTTNTAKNLVSVNFSTKQFSFPVRVQLLDEDFSRVHLRHVFGDLYEESGSVPRRFSIDVTENVKSAFSKCTCKNRRDLYWKADLTTYFIVEPCEENKTGSCLSAWIYLNGSYEVRSMKLETVNSFSPYSLEGLVKKAAEYITILPDDCFYLRDSVFSYSMKSHTQGSVMSSLHGYEIASLRPSDALKVANTSKKQDEEDCSVLDEYDIPSDQWCNICFDKINNSSSEASSATALKSCAHFFCNDCWRGHLGVKVRNGSPQLLCPEFGCEETVDTTTALTLLPYHLYTQYLNLAQDIAITTNQCFKWCPSAQCGRVLMAKSRGGTDSMVDVECACGQNLCFSCLHEAHWPASCDQYQIYLRRLKFNGDVDVKFERITSCSVKTKRCPKCNHPIEKNGGCPHMLCRCGYDFCWKCLERFHYGPCVTVKSEVMELSKIPVHQIASSVRSKFYIISVEHRTAQSPAHRTKLKLHLRHLISKIKTKHIASMSPVTVQTGEFPCTSETLNDGSVGRRWTIAQLMKSAITMSLQVHHMLEYSAVLIDCHRNKKQTKPLYQQLLLLQSLVQEIDNLFLTPDNQDGRKILLNLRFFMENVKRNLPKFSKCIRKIKSCEASH